MRFSRNSSYLIGRMVALEFLHFSHRKSTNKITTTSISEAYIIRSGDIAKYRTYVSYLENITSGVAVYMVFLQLTRLLRNSQCWSQNLLTFNRFFAKCQARYASVPERVLPKENRSQRFDCVHWRYECVTHPQNHISSRIFRQNFDSILYSNENERFHYKISTHRDRMCFACLIGQWISQYWRYWIHLSHS